LVIDGQLTLGQLIAFRIISGYVTQPILRLSTLWQRLEELKISFERLADIMDRETEKEEKSNIILMPKLEGKIIYSNISFSFSELNKPVIKNINLEFQKNTINGIVGQSGSGKSTLIKLLSRIYQPTNGKIIVDGYDINKFIRKIEINGFKFLYELLALSKGKLAVNEVPLIFKERRFGNSKLDIAIVWDFLISIIHNLTLRILPRRAISFGMVGISGVFVQLFVTSCLVEIFLVDFYNALPFAVIIAATSNFLINNQVTFRSDRLENKALLVGLLKFLFVASLPVIANVGITTAFYKYISADTFVAQIAGIAIVYAWNYLASSSFVWKKSI